MAKNKAKTGQYLNSVSERTAIKRLDIFSIPAEERQGGLFSPVARVRRVNFSFKDPKPVYFSVSRILSAAESENHHFSHSA
ncbi:MAG: hypothetical protein EOL98_14180 [Negativicutes bacterium]|nr:hypothetical protein [Negativicutes bacterium]